MHPIRTILLRRARFAWLLLGGSAFMCLPVDERTIVEDPAAGSAGSAGSAGQGGAGGKGGGAAGSGASGAAGSTSAGGASGADGGGAGSDGTSGGSAGEGATGGSAGSGGNGTGGASASGGTGGAGGTGGNAGSGGSGGTLITVTPVNCEAPPVRDKYSPGYGSDAAYASRLSSKLASMDKGEKLMLIRGGQPGDFDDVSRTEDIPSATVKGYRYREGSRGVNLTAGQPGRTSDGNDFSTAFPVAAARGAAFDLELEYRIGAAMGDEMVASGNDLLLAPKLNLLRHPAWGRAQEAYGEDPYHVGRVGSALIAGIQTYIGACAGAFAGYDVEKYRNALLAQVDEQALREIYARPFEMAVEDAGVACVMAAYTILNGERGATNPHLLTELLRDDYGFPGFTISSWWGLSGGVTEPPDAASGETIARLGLDAGLDVEAPWSLNFGYLYNSAGADAGIDAAAARVLRQKYRFNTAELGTSGLKSPATSLDGSSIADNDAHIALSRQAATEGMVLLKNDGVLPIADSVAEIVVIGAELVFTLSVPPFSGTTHFATDQPLGDYASSRVNADPAKTVSPFDGLYELGDGRGITVRSGTSAADVGSADFAVVVVGNTPQEESEEFGASEDTADRLTLSLPAAQDDLVAQVAATGVPTVVVIESGGMVHVPWLDDVDAAIMAFYPGQQGGRALADLLFGVENFSGKLPVTWYDENQIDAATLWEPTAPPTSVLPYFFGYRAIDQGGASPVFPFGHGLSYTTFTYSNLQLGCLDVTKDSVADIYVDVENDTNVAGDEIVFLFTSSPNRTVTHAVKELRGFARVPLNGREKRSVKLPLRIADLKYWDDAAGEWKLDAETVQILVGPSSDAARGLTGSLPVID